MGKGKRKAGREVTPPGKGGGQNLREGSRHVLASLLVGCPLLVLLGVGPFFRGLFFPGEYLVALAVVFALFAGYYLYASGRQYERPRRPIEWAGLALAVCYWAASLVAVQPRTAVAEALKYTAYMAVLWLVARLAGERRWAFAVAGVLVASATGVAILGLGVPAGTFSYTGAFDGGRLSSSLQYPNTAATYLSAGIVLAAGLAAAIMPLATQVHASAGKAGLTAATGGLLAGAIAIMFMAFAFTMSRGGYLVFPPLVLVLIALLPAGRRLPGLITLGAGLIGGGMVIPSLGRILSGAKGPAVWSWVAIGGLGAVLLAAGGLALAILVRRGGAAGGAKRRLSPAYLAAGVAGLVVVGVLVLGWRSGESTLAALVPAQIKQRVAAIDLGESGAQDRLQWSRDALKLAGQRPLLGAGGGGWNALYGTVQTYAYFSTEVHNHFAQVWVEGGTLGFLAFLAVWAGAGWAYWRGRRTDAPLSAAAFVAAGGLGVHALIDFNLSLSAVSFMLWALFGLVAAGEPVPTGDGGAAGVVRPGRAAAAHRGAAGPAHSAAGPSPWYLRLGIPVVCVALLSLTVSLRAGYGAGQRAAAALNAGDAERALVAFATACRYDPWTASFHIDLGQVYERQAGEAKTRELLAKARAEFERGVSLDPYNFQYRALYGRFLLRHGEADAGLAQLQKAIECRPALAAGYENLATASVLVGAAMADRGELDKARAYLQSVRTVAADMARRSTLVPAFVQRADYRLPASTPRLSLALGQASLLLGDTNTARQSLEAAVKDRQLQPEANLWLGAWALVAGQDPQPYLAQAGSIPDARGQAELIATRTRQLAAK